MDRLKNALLFKFKKRVQHIENDVVYTAVSHIKRRMETDTGYSVLKGKAGWIAFVQTVERVEYHRVVGNYGLRTEFYSLAYDFAGYVKSEQNFCNGRVPVPRKQPRIVSLVQVFQRSKFIHKYHQIVYTKHIFSSDPFKNFSRKSCLSRAARSSAFTEKIFRPAFGICAG